MSRSMRGSVQFQRRNRVQPPRAPAATFITSCVDESFDKADGVLGPDLSWTYFSGVTGDGGLEVVDNQMTPVGGSPGTISAGGVARAESELSGASMSVTVTVGTIDATGPSVPVVQALAGMSDAADASTLSVYQLMWTDLGGNGFFIVKFENGSGGDSSSVYPSALVEGDQFTLELNHLGATAELRALLNGVEIITWTDSSPLPQGTFAGAGCEVFADSLATTDIRITAFEACAL